MKMDYAGRPAKFQRRATEVLEMSGIANVWKEAGCRVNIIGSMAMGLMAKHRDIDLHVYSPEVTEQSSFAIMARIAADTRVKGIKCINGLTTEEHCIAWHVSFEAEPGEIWQFDIIHIVAGTCYDGFFERMAQRIAENATTEQKETILRLKFETPEGEEIHGVEYYEAVMACGVTTLEELRRWITERRAGEFYYWMP